MAATVDVVSNHVRYAEWGTCQKLEKRTRLLEEIAPLNCLGKARIEPRVLEPLSTTDSTLGCQSVARYNHVSGTDT